MQPSLPTSIWAIAVDFQLAMCNTLPKLVTNRFLESVPMSAMYPPYGAGPNGNAPTIPCQRCGLPLPPTVAQCSRCGYMKIPMQPHTSFPTGQLPQPQQLQPPSPTSWNPTQSQQPPWLSQFLGQPPVSSVPPASNNPFNGSTAAPQAPNNPFNGFTAPPQAPNNPFNTSGAPKQPSGMLNQPPNLNNYYGTSGVQQPFGIPGQSQTWNPNGSYSTQSQPLNSTALSSSASQQLYPTAAAPFTTSRSPHTAASPPPDFPFPEPAPEEKRRPRLALIIGLAALLLILTGGSVFAVYLYLGKPPNTTATTTPTVTPRPSPTFTGKPLFSDTFANNKSGWDTTSQKGKFSVTVGGGSLVLEDDQNNLLPEFLPGNTTYSNFVLVVNAQLSKGDPINGYGIYIRGATNQNSPLATYYRFELYGDGTYGIFKGVVDPAGHSSTTTLVDSTTTPSPAIQLKGSTNQIVLIASGQKMTLMVNGQTVKSISDTSYASGTITLFVSNAKNVAAGAQATFSHVVIYPPQP